MIRRAALNVSLTPELIAFVSEQVASGRYGSASEVVRAVLRALERQEARGAGRTQAARSAQQR